MTREEAVSELEFLASCSYVDRFEPTEKEALKMAIDALKQEPCEDAISRQEVLSYLCAHCPDNAECFDDCDDIKNIKALPFVRPQEPFNIDTYCKEHFCVMVEKDVWEKAEKALKQESCEDAISRHDVECIVEELENICHNAPQEVLELLAKLKNAPFATLYPKTGHWVEENVNGGGRRVFCSECGCPPPFEHISTGDVYSASGYGVINKTKFCPNCGAKMESEVTE